MHTRLAQRWREKWLNGTEELDFNVGVAGYVIDGNASVCSRHARSHCADFNCVGSCFISFLTRRDVV